MKSTIEEISSGLNSYSWQKILPAFYGMGSIYEVVEAAIASIAAAKQHAGRPTSPVTKRSTGGTYSASGYTENVNKYKAFVESFTKIIYTVEDPSTPPSTPSIISANEDTVISGSFHPKTGQVKISSSNPETIEKVISWCNENFTEEQEAGTVYILMSTQSGLDFEEIGNGGSPLIEENYSPEVLTAFNRLKTELIAPKPHGRLSILEGPPGSGKCLGIGTPVMKFDGTVVPVQDVVAGDDLMGPDGLARRVLTVNTGNGELYRISPVSGDSWSSWVCNDVHMLTLRNTTSGAVLDIALNDYLTQTDEYKAQHKMYRQPIGAGNSLLPITEFAFEAVSIGAGDYYGFTLDGDGRFLLGDFTVTHNTHLVRALLTELSDKATFVVVQSTLVEQLVGPGGISAVLKFRANNPERPLIFVLEDADAVLAPRNDGNMSLVSSMLNMGDGIVGNTLDIRIVCTTNATQMQLDAAVKRPGRLTVLEHVGALSADQATKTLQRLTGDATLTTDKPLTLAEIYQRAYDQGFKQVKSTERKMGFGS